MSLNPSGRILTQHGVSRSQLSVLCCSFVKKVPFSRAWGRMCRRQPRALATFAACVCVSLRLCGSACVFEACVWALATAGVPAMSCGVYVARPGAAAVQGARRAALHVALRACLRAAPEALACLTGLPADPAAAVAVAPWEAGALPLGTASLTRWRDRTARRAR